MRSVSILVVAVFLAGCGRPALYEPMSGGDSGAPPKLDSYDPSSTTWNLLFDGQDDFVDVATTTAFDVSSFAIEVWIRPDDLGDAHIISDAVDDEGFLLELSEESLRFTVYDLEGDTHRVESDSLDAGEWYHVAISYRDAPDPKHLWMFVNGQLEDDTNVGDIEGMAFDPGTAPRFGADIDNGEQQFQGVIRDVRFSSSPRYTTDFAPPGMWLAPDPNTIALWPLNDGPPSQVATDLIAAHHATLGTTPTPDPQDPTWITPPGATRKVPRTFRAPPRTFRPPPTCTSREGRGWLSNSRRISGCG